MTRIYNTIFVILINLIAFSFFSCNETPDNIQAVSEAPNMYPDYTDITIPQNIAPLNFLIRGDISRVCVYADNKEIYNGSGNEVTFSKRMWQNLMTSTAGKTIKIKIIAKENKQWKEYREFTWKVVSDKVDPYLTYRLIEPDYEVYANLVLQERCVENFETKNFSDHNIVGNKCMNCHIYANQDPNTSMFYIRGEGGGAILNINGNLQKLNIKRSDMVSGSVYFGFSPSKRYIVFSTNVIIPAFHSTGSKRLEVFDSKSDVYVADIKNNKFIESNLLNDSTKLETFPTFSPDGKYIYYCTAVSPDSLGAITSLKYSLCRVAFNEKNGTIGTQVDTIYNARTEGKSVCHPRISPDGRFLVFTTADYGTFPIWHREADLAMINLENGKLISMDKANSDMSDTYHSWSSNSRWLVFASKRDDGLYGKPYYTYIDKNGMCSKPFALPQAHPTFYDNCLKSFNAPEQGCGALPFSVSDVRKALSASPIEFR